MRKYIFKSSVNRWLVLSKRHVTRQRNNMLKNYRFCHQDFTLDVYFRQYWKDERLSFTKQRGIDILTISTEFLRNMWVPDTFFANEKTAYLHMVTTSNEFVRIRHDGEITRSMRYVYYIRDPEYSHRAPSNRGASWIFKWANSVCKKSFVFLMIYVVP